MNDFMLLEKKKLEVKIYKQLRISNFKKEPLVLPKLFKLQVIIEENQPALLYTICTLISSNTKIRLERLRSTKIT